MAEELDPTALGTPGPLNGYVCLYRGKRVEIHAPTTYEAQQKAAAHFKARKAYEVTVHLAEVGGKAYEHTAD